MIFFCSVFNTMFNEMMTPSENDVYFFFFGSKNTFLFEMENDHVNNNQQQQVNQNRLHFFDLEV